MTSFDIKYCISALFSNQNYMLYNTYIFQWESDFFCISSSGYISEVEIKISKSDFKNDFSKTTLSGNHKKHDYMLDNTKNLKPNKFYFACPDGLISKDEINENYGLIYCKDYSAKIVKQPKFLHKELLLNNLTIVTQMMKKYYYRNMELRRMMDLRDIDLKYGQKIIDFIY